MFQDCNRHDRRHDGRLDRRHDGRLDRCLSGRLDGHLAGLLDGPLAGCLAGCLAGRLNGHLAGRLAGCRDGCWMYQNDWAFELIKHLLLVIWSEKEFGHQRAKKTTHSFLFFRYYGYWKLKTLIDLNYELKGKPPQVWASRKRAQRKDCRKGWGSTFTNEIGPSLVLPLSGVERQARCWFLWFDTLLVKKRYFQEFSTPSSGQKMQKTCIFEPNWGPPLSRKVTK